MPIIHHPELGKVTIRRNVRTRHIRIRVAPDGSLRVSAPSYTPLFAIKRTLNSSTEELRAMISAQRPATDYRDGAPIGKSHTLIVRDGQAVTVKRQGLHIIVSLPQHKTLQDEDVQTALSKEIIAALRREAKGYLPKRLAYLADQHGFHYERVRFSHAGSRWGSCSSSGTISLNIALMKLPFELIDYVLIHELAHTRHMDHSDAFWAVVAAGNPNYKLHRKRLKQETPAL